MRATLPRRFTTKLVGMTFVDGYPANLVGIERDLLTMLGNPVLVDLARDPDNPVDANAVVVTYKGDRIGHVPKAIAERLAPELDAGERWEAHVVEVKIHPDHGEHPGIELRLDRA